MVMVSHEMNFVKKFATKIMFLDEGKISFLGSVDEATEIAKYTATATNCWVLSGKSHNTTQFTEGSLKSIKSAFGGQTNWDVSGNQPQLTTFVIVTDSSKYVPGAVTTGTTSTTTGTTTVSPASAVTFVTIITGFVISVYVGFASAI